MKIKIIESRCEDRDSFSVVDREGNSVAHAFLKDGEDFIAINVHRWLDIKSLKRIVEKLEKCQDQKLSSRLECSVDS